MTENKNVFGILGHPLGHTLSPQIHTRLFEISGEQAEYKILDTPPEKLTDSFESVSYTHLRAHETGFMRRNKAEL